MAISKEKKKFLKKQQEERRKKNKENKLVEIVSYDDYLKWAEDKNFESEDWLICEINSRKKIEYLLNHLNPKDILMMEDKLTEAMIAIINICEHLYSPLIKSNLELQTIAKDTIINYYRNRFEIRNSAEISILPLELRLFIYIELLKRESSKYFLVNILDRIALTLKKMEMHKEYEAAAYVLSWAEMILFITTEPLKYYNNFHFEVFKKELGSNKGFTSLLMGNDLSMNYAVQKRGELLNQYGMGIVDKVYVEFWYGVDIFSDQEKIQDMDAAQISLNLFCEYFKNIAPFMDKLQSNISNYYAGKMSSADLKKSVESYRFDQLDILAINELYSLDNIQHEPVITQKKEEWYCVLRGERALIDYYEVNELDECISPQFFAKIIKRFIDRFENGMSFFIPNVEEYLLKLYAGVLMSEEWTEDVKILILDALNMLRGHMWENRNLSAMRQNIKDYFENLLTIDYYSNMRNIGQGKNTIALSCEDGVVMYRTDRYDKRLHLATKIMKNCRMDHVEEAFTRIKDMIILGDLANRAFLPQNNVLPGNRLLETTLSEKKQNELFLAKVKLGMYKKIESYIRDFDIESYVFKVNSRLDLVFGQEKELVVIAKNTFEADMKEGVAYYRNKQYVNAAKCFLNLLDKYPQSGILFYYIANSFGYMTGGREYSLRFYREALKYDDYVEIWVDYGNMLRNMRRMEEAIYILEIARKKFPNDGSPAMILTSIYKDDALYRIMKAESVRKRSANYNEIIGEWESENQILKPVVEDFV